MIMTMNKLLNYFMKLGRYMAFYKMQIIACNKTAHHILKNEVDLILPKFPKDRKVSKESLV